MRYTCVVGMCVCEWEERVLESTNVLRSVKSQAALAEPAAAARTASVALVVFRATAEAKRPRRIVSAEATLVDFESLRTTSWRWLFVQATRRHVGLD